jgi:N-acetylmuramoyl-L-alanine amidase
LDQIFPADDQANAVRSSREPRQAAEAERRSLRRLAPARRYGLCVPRDVSRSACRLAALVVAYGLILVACLSFASAGAASDRLGLVRAERPALPLAGKVVGIDPGHNGLNYTDPTFINQLIWNGREEETCDTTGTETDAGYTEAQFNFNVARFLAADLQAEGARVVLTRSSNAGVGPCVTTRSEIINRAHANVAIDIHADGGPADGRGFAILEPVADGPNDHVIDASAVFGAILLDRYRAITGMPVSTYDGVDGIADRDDLAGLNLTAVPKVLIECGNMRNATDAALLVSTSFQKLAAKAFAAAIAQYLKAGR